MDKSQAMEYTFSGMIDAHAHVGALTEEAVEVARAAGVVGVVVVAEGRAEFDAARKLRDAFPDLVRVCCGVHPVQEGRSVRVEEWDGVDEWVRAHAAELSGVGECGLDFAPWTLLGPDWRARGDEKAEAERDAQRHVLEKQVALARELGLALNCHSRMAAKYVLPMVRDAPYVLLHAFDGSAKVAREAVACGNVFLSVSPATARDPSMLSLLRAGVVPLDRLVLETDAPALGVLRGLPSTPAMVAVAAAVAARALDVPIADVVEQTTRNANRLFPARPSPPPPPPA
jgi:TatD DNase family protein